MPFPGQRAPLLPAPLQRAMLLLLPLWGMLCLLWLLQHLDLLATGHGTGLLFLCALLLPLPGMRLIARRLGDRPGL